MIIKINLHQYKIEILSIKFNIAKIPDVENILVIKQSEINCKRLYFLFQFQMIKWDKTP